jgi:hypothetical protein
MDDETLTAIGLAGKGYGGGDPEAVLAMPVGTVIGMTHYVSFEQQYLTTLQHLRQEDAKK